MNGRTGPACTRSSKRPLQGIIDCDDSQPWKPNRPLARRVSLPAVSPMDGAVRAGPSNGQHNRSAGVLSECQAVAA